MEITCTVPLNSHMQITDSNLDIPRPEEELPVEIRLFNDIHVSDDDVSIWADTDTHHSPVLQHLTANSTGPDLPHTQLVRQLELHGGLTNTQSASGDCQTTDQEGWLRHTGRSKLHTSLKLDIHVQDC